LRAVDLIIKKKNGGTLTREEIHYLIDGYVKGEIPDYQMSSFLMAVCFQGLNEKEQSLLTTEMLYSGETVDLSLVGGICVDKHSTGGVGDKTTLSVAPIVASCGLKIAKMSGRGLGHTGGTLDKLESIPGFQISISKSDFLKQVREISLAVVGQTANIAPADKKLYALRDVTGTVESIGLIASSIMSKKLASGASRILLDVKVGDGAFMKNLRDAKTLAKAMVAIGNNNGRKTMAILTDMSQPLGEAVGNAIEVIEAIETLKGRGPEDFRRLVEEISAELLMLGDAARNKEDAVAKVKDAIESGRALKKLRQMITYQHGNPDVTEDYSLFPKAAEEIPVLSEKEGYVKDIKALKIGSAAMILGAGRAAMDDTIDPAVGIKVLKKVGDRVEKGETIAILYTNGKNTEEARQEVLQSYEIITEKTEKKNIILDMIY
jgi:pyrimidine-nucleoside phosphorylase